MDHAAYMPKYKFCLGATWNSEGHVSTAIVFQQLSKILEKSS